MAPREIVFAKNVQKDLVDGDDSAYICKKSVGKLRNIVDMAGNTLYTRQVRGTRRVPPRTV